MSLVKPVRGKAPVFGADCFLAETAVVVGDVEMGDRCSVWFHAVVRGDVNSIRMGDQVNVQDGAVIHCTFEKAATRIGNNVSIGHNAIVHGCTVRDNVLVGMGSILMDHCDVGSYSIIAAGAVVPQGTVIPEGSIYAGVPARKIGEVRPELRTGEIERIAKAYTRYSGWFREGSPED
ncbi:gamma carbonic anhydrase family protein [Robiginitalea biformata]|uniref:Putative hexapeptide repeat protein n=1 Tax=Robiginitalea biformata (strain ATCC BAA-864 / DSM 15991 / KCTC 12146 / HTCC2501) TaxID=313596 RepID=A4CG59_ROBBH|nr:gamma carbonic anhydrase family protein [Robiginitalea biformata]EAR15917.1 putative hexapeptide repeat protein [Robiginitalea biformata HTCC2501]